MRTTTSDVDAALETALLEAVQAPLLRIGAVLVVSPLLLVAPGWVLLALGFDVAARLPLVPSLLLPTTALGLGAACIAAARAPRLTSGRVALLWWLVLSSPGLVGAASSVFEPAHLTVLVRDVPLVVWSSGVAISGLLLRPRFSLLLGAWCAAQFASLAWLGSRLLPSFSGPEPVVALHASAGSAVGPTVTLLLAGILAAGSAGWFRTLVTRRVAMEARALEEQRRREREQLERRAAEAINEAKSVFVAQLGHELRSPLTGVLGHADLLAQDTTLRPDQRGRAQRIVDGARHLAELVADTSDLALVEAGRVELRPRAVDVRALLGTVEAGAQVQAADGVVVRSSVDPALPARLQADPKRLRQIASNLVSNALKNTTEGSISIAARHAGGSRWLLEVADTGRGIAAADQATVFEAYAQAGPASAQARGTGLGLHITRTLVDAMAGAIALHSEEHVGTAVVVELPLVSADDEPIAEAPVVGVEPPRADGSEDGAAWALPDAEALQLLHELAERGDMRGLVGALSRLADDPALAPFVVRVRELAEEFDDQGILALLTEAPEPRHA